MYLARILLRLLLLGVSLAPTAGAWARTPPEAAIASAHPLATAAGLEILQAGGNAFDAAVAVSAALAVVEPYSSGLGGGGFFLLHRAADGLQVMIDARETAPAAASPALFTDSGGRPIPEKSRTGPLAAGIPGIPAALEHLASRYGRLRLAASLKPAIRYAREGFRISEHYRRMAELRLEALRSFPASAAIFLRHNEVPPPEHLLVQRDLAGTLELLAAEGAAGFYQGPLAERMVRAVGLGGGIWQLEDLAGYRVIERAPIVSAYRGIRVVSAAPPSAGGIVLAQALNILEEFNLHAMNAVLHKHLVVEALRRAYRDRAAYLGDPDFSDIPIARLLDKDYAAGLAAEIRLDAATPSTSLAPLAPYAEATAHTTHFSILDTEGNRVAATLSINLPFGTGFVAEGTGVLLNDEIDDFSIRPLAPNAYGLVTDEANVIGPRKRPLSSMTPTFLETGDRIAILGTPGGSRIISMVLLAALDFAAGHLPDSWVRLKRFHHQYLPDEIQFEPGALTGEEQDGLRALGHALKDVGRDYGNMQAVLWYKSINFVFAASDPRGEGVAETTRPGLTAQSR
jgi:gamma-glutamyltranspeptidase/glutathione hydrolase